MREDWEQLVLFPFFMEFKVASMKEINGTKVISSKGERDFKSDDERMLTGVKVFSNKGEGALEIDRSQIISPLQAPVEKPKKRK